MERKIRPSPLIPTDTNSFAVAAATPVSIPSHLSSPHRSPHATRRPSFSNSPTSPIAETQSFVHRSHSFCESPAAPVPARCNSLPPTPIAPAWSPATLNSRRRRIKSADNPKLEWRFGATVAITRSPVNARHSLEITTQWGRSQTKLTIEFRRLLFWFVVAASVLLPVSGLKVTPQAQMIVRSGQADLFRKPARVPALPPSASAFEDHVDSNYAGPERHLESQLATPLEAKSHSAAVVDPLLEEISGIVVKEGTQIGFIGPDDGSVHGVVSQIAQLFHKGDVSATTLRTTAVRSCISVVMHKTVALALASDFVSDVVACVLPHTDKL